MEIKSTIHDHVAVRFNVCILFFVMLVAGRARAQQSTAYTVKNGKMYIEMSRQIRTSALDSFITAFDLSDLGLRQFFRNNNADSLQRLGWQVERNNKQGFVISKPLAAVDNIVNPADKIIFTEKHRSFAERFPPVNNGILYGYNRFRNQPFAVSDSVVIFFLRNNLKASRVRLAGSFNDWLPDALSMNKTDSGWIARVKLGPGKYWYKFIVDGNWMADPDNLIRENDGVGN
ncbi:MAG TPA: glycogen-binding domain-containing protein, partial [Flavisolibacter sp.]|nr:glycogen-binding domain-containing protein [Flavisolibacter sp.]